MKLAYVVPTLVNGGAERVVIDLANAMAERGHEVTIVAARVPVFARDLDPRIDVQVVTGSRSRLRPYFAMVRWIWANRRWVLSRDLVHCHLTFAASFATLVAGLRATERSSRPALVETYHAVGMPMPAALRAAHAALMRARDVVAFMAEDPFWAGFRARNKQLATLIIPNGVRAQVDRPTDKAVREYRLAAGLPEGVPVVGTVGRLVPERQPWRLVEAFARVAAEQSDLHFLIAGDGPERPRLEQQIARLGLSHRVHLPGLIENPSLAFANTDLYVTLNVGSHTGLAGLEAVAFGLPVIALQLIGGRRASEDDWIWSSPSSEQLGTRIDQLIGDKTARQQIAEQQNSYLLSNLTADVMIDAYEDLYRQVMQRRHIRDRETSCQLTT